MKKLPLRFYHSFTPQGKHVQYKKWALLLRVKRVTFGKYINAEKITMARSLKKIGIIK